MLKEGDRLPDVTLPGSNGDVRLHDLLGKQALVVYFYPKDETAGCTKEACSFRDSYEDFKAAGAEVIGISGDTVASHDAFARHHRLPFILLSDPGAKARIAFGVGKKLGMFQRRVTFVFDKAGVARLVFESDLRFTKHVTEALDIVKQLERAA